jgi:hypothetical protein
VVAGRDYFMQTETGPLGQITIRKVYYTPEQLASRNELFAPTSRPADPLLGAVESRWPKLTTAQRAVVLEHVKSLSNEK